MTFRDGDTMYPHHPDTVPAGDYAVNNRPGDTWYLVVDDFEQGTAWDILNELLQGTSWHIHPATYAYIAQFVLNYIETAFELQNTTTNFTVCPVKTSFQVTHVLDDNVSLAPFTGMTAISINKIETDFELRVKPVYNFTITRVFDNIGSE